MTRVICVIGGKGGVGKTTITSNLASALADFGQKVIAVDTNLTTPNLGLHFGVHLAPFTLHDILKGKSKLKDSIYIHPNGVNVLPASMSIDDLEGVDVSRLHEITFSLKGKYDFILLDGAAGLGREAVSGIMAADEILIVTNPDLPSVADALKTIKLAERLGKKIIGVVVNRIRGKDYELTKEEVEEMTGYPVIAMIPEDKNVSKAIFSKTPVVNYSPNSPAALEIKKLACSLLGIPFVERRVPRGFLLFEKLIRWALRK